MSRIVNHNHSFSLHCASAGLWPGVVKGHLLSLVDMTATASADSDVAPRNLDNITINTSLQSDCTLHSIFEETYCFLSLSYVRVHAD